MTTLNEDFGIWWNMSKYTKQDIPAKKFGEVKIVERHGSNSGWPIKEQKDVKYWVLLENGWAVGFHHPKVNERRAKYARFPMVNMLQLKN